MRCLLRRLRQGGLERVGLSDETRLLIVFYCERAQGNIIRIISARKATKNESSYYQGVKP